MLAARRSSIHTCREPCCPCLIVEPQKSGLSTVEATLAGVLDSRIKVVFRIRPHGTWERWRSKMDRSFKFGNLVACICDNAVSQPIWMLVACRDVKSRTVALGLYSAGEDDTSRLARMWDAGKLMLIASTTYFRSLEPVLRRLQDAQQVGFPFKEELVYCQTTPRRPSNVHAADPVDWKLFFRGPWLGVALVSS